MSEYRFGVTCPQCGGELAHENASRPTDLGRRVSAVVKCSRKGCRKRWQIVTEILQARDLSLSEVPS